MIGGCLGGFSSFDSEQSCSDHSLSDF
jgi:hypothetical protein